MRAIVVASIAALGSTLVLGCVEEEQVPVRTQPASTVVVSHPGTTIAQAPAPASPPVVNNIVQPAPAPPPNVTVVPQPAPAATTSTTTTTTAPAAH